MTAEPQLIVDSDLIVQADTLRAQGDLATALDLYVAAAGKHEIPPAQLCLKIARAHRQHGDIENARQWLMRVVDGGDDFVSWQAAAGLLVACAPETWPAARRARVAVLGSFTTTQFVPLLRLAARRLGLAVDTYECAYAQYRQEILDPASELYRFSPDFVVLMVHEGAADLPEISAEPGSDLQRELARWTSLWTRIEQHATARVVQFTFAQPPIESLGHLGARLAGSRHRMLQELNLGLGEAAGDRVAIVDCARLASNVGLQRWFDPRFWHLAKHAVAPACQPLLARHTAAVLAAELGLTRKCIAVDLDNTLWGGVVGEDGPDGIRIGDSADGEAFAAFQESLLQLKRKGLLLAVCSKNNPADAREPFAMRPEMRLSLTDFACFIADWRPKAEQLQEVARTLDLDLDSIVFVDDNPAERDLIRRMLPQVDVLTLPEDPAEYAGALSDDLLLQTRAYTPEDAQRTDHYAARARIMASREAASSLDEFYRSLEMEAIIAPFTNADLPRIAQLIGKSNQFNLTTRRHSLQELQEFSHDPRCVHFSLRLRDRFVDHGLVSTMIALQRDDHLDIETWVMSCRVIGRTVEAEMLQQLCHAAQHRGCRSLRGTYIPTPKNGMVADLFARFDFARHAADFGTTVWAYDIAEKGAITNSFMRTHSMLDKGRGDT